MFGKFFTSAFTGSMLGCGADVFAVWGYIIAHTGPDSMVELNPTLIGVQIGMQPEAVNKAIKYLLAPDPNSRSKKEDGARLVQHGQFLYEVTNHAQYRAIRDNIQRKEANREYKRLSRARASVSHDVSTSATMSAQAEAEAEAYTDTEKEGLPPSLNIDAWNLWIEDRKRRRLPQYTTNREAKRLAKLSHDEQMACVEYSLDRYKGLFPEKHENGSHSKASDDFDTTRAKLRQAAGLD